MSKFSKRLQTILDHSIHGLPFWDLCCDHGLLGEQALKQNLASVVHFNDQVEHIMNSLIVRMQGVEGKVVFHLKPAEMIDQEITGNLAIAGVGGNTLVKILKTLDVNSFLQADRILLNPATRLDVLEQFLASWQSYKPVQKLDFTENGIERSVYVLEKPVSI